jgi:hypothetical protein
MQQKTGHFYLIIVHKQKIHEDSPFLDFRMGNGILRQKAANPRHLFGKCHKACREL